MWNRVLGQATLEEEEVHGYVIIVKHSVAVEEDDGGDLIAALEIKHALEGL